YDGAAQSPLGQEPDHGRDRLSGAGARGDPEDCGHQSMTAGLLIGFFLFILAAVGAAGYVFVLRPSRAEGAGVAVPAPIALDQRELPTAQAAMVGVFRMLGEAIPGPGSRAAGARLQLIAAGYRWPAALSIFSGIKGATALLLGVAAAWGAMLYRSD